MQLSSYSIELMKPSSPRHFHQWIVRLQIFQVRTMHFRLRGAELLAIFQSHRLRPVISMRSMQLYRVANNQSSSCIISLPGYGTKRCTKLCKHLRFDNSAMAEAQYAFVVWAGTQQKNIKVLFHH